jgi:hypothetical protein
MKTTIEIADPLFSEAKRAATERGTTLRALVEQGLRAVLEASDPAGSFRLADASVSGNGLQPGFRGAGWDEIRDAAYEGRGS